MGIKYSMYADVVRCSPLSECSEWGKCARSLPAGPSLRTVRFEHFGPPYKQGAKCPHLIRLLEEPKPTTEED